MKASAAKSGMYPLNAQNDFDRGVQIANNALYSGRVKIHKNCVNLLNEAGSYRWNPQESRPTTGPDHAIDTFRYGCYWKFPNYRTEFLK